MFISSWFGLKFLFFEASIIFFKFCSLYLSILLLFSYSFRRGDLSFGSGDLSEAYVGVQKSLILAWKVISTTLKWSSSKMIGTYSWIPSVIKLLILIFP